MQKIMMVQNLKQIVNSYRIECINIDKLIILYTVNNEAYFEPQTDPLTLFMCVAGV